jgi:EpsI family protein
VSADPASPWNPVFTGADRVERAEYAGPAGREVQVYIASYAVQAQDKELVTYGNSLIGPKEGSIVSESPAPSAIARELVVQGERERSLIRYYYDVGGRRIDRGLIAQLWYGLGAMRRPVVSSVFALRAVCTADCDQARVLIDEFAARTDAVTDPTEQLK